MIKKTNHNFLNEIDTKTLPYMSNQVIDQNKVKNLTKTVELNNISKRTDLKRFFMINNLTKNKQKQERLFESENLPESDEVTFTNINFVPKSKDNES